MSMDDHRGAAEDSKIDDGPLIPLSASDILSSFHGRQRRLERGISKTEFHAAVKFGKRSPASVDSGKCDGRWLFTYKAGGIAVVTNSACTEEITSWPLPCWGFDIEKVDITLDMLEEHDKAVEDSKHQHRWNSHTVAVLDQSGSMRKTDVTSGATRSDLVWLCLAIDCIGKRLKSGEVSSQDYFSLIELGSKEKYLIRQHPFNWILYNKIIDMLRNRSPVGHGYYLPAIKLAEEALLFNKMGNCVLQLLFLSDGAPSDTPPRGYGQGRYCFKPPEYHKEEIGKRIAFLARKFGSRLSVGAITVSDSEIHILEHIARTAAEYNCHVFLSKATLNANDLSSAFHSMTTLLTNTKSAATDVVTNRQRTFRDIIREPKSSVALYSIDDGKWSRYTSDVKRAYFDKREYKWVYPQRKFNHPLAVGLVVRDEVFGEGKERAVRRVREIAKDGRIVGPALVGKESLYVEDMKDSISFHKTFCKVQQLSQKVATHFNKIILRLPGVKRSVTPLINFLECYVMLLSDNKGILVEKMLNHTRYKKFNSNDGYVDGMSREEYANIKNGTRKRTAATMIRDCSFTTDDIPQAFSHFSYIFSKRKFLVCDLQGVLSTDTDEPLLELTDPVIHYSEMTNRDDYGRTDRGQQGIDDFFRSHKCSNLCHMLHRRWISDPLEKNTIHHEYEPSIESLSETTPGNGSDSEDKETKAKKAKVDKTVKFMF